MIKLFLFSKDRQLSHVPQDGTGHPSIHIRDLLLHTCFSGEVSSENTVRQDS